MYSETDKQMEEIKQVRSKQMRGYLYVTLKKTTPDGLARAVQRVLTLPVTGVFDEATINRLNRLALRSYPIFKARIEKYIRPAVN